MGHFFNNRNLIFGILIILAVFTNFFRLEYRHGFAWDQERDANVVYSEMIERTHPTLIGPQVAGPTGFFLGPLHYYILAPFYFLTGGDPRAGALFAAVLGVITVVILMLVVNKIFNKESAYLIGFVAAVNPTVRGWNVAYLGVLSVLHYAICYDLVKNKSYKKILIGYLIIALAMQSHFTGIFLLLNLLFSILISRHNRADYREIFLNNIIGIIILLISFLPLFLFDLRHEFLNSHNFINFFLKNSSSQGFEIFNGPIIFLRSFNLISGYFIQYPELNILIGILSLQGYLYLSNKIGFSPLKKLNFFWVFSPLLIFLLYRGQISEYYFLTASTIVFMYVGYFLSLIYKKDKRPVYFLLTAIVVFNIFHIFTAADAEAIVFKRKAVEYIVRDSKNKTFSVVYEMPEGFKNGYGYLFKFNHHEPDIISNNQYRIIYPISDEIKNKVVQFGPIGVLK